MQTHTYTHIHRDTFAVNFVQHNNNAENDILAEVDKSCLHTHMCMCKRKCV